MKWTAYEELECYRSPFFTLYKVVQHSRELLPVKHKHQVLLDTLAIQIINHCAILSSLRKQAFSALHLWWQREMFKCTRS